MKHPFPPLNGLKVFESAARHLSFSIAADELFMSKGAVSYQIRKLEEHVQCTLFKRTVRQVYLTDAGQSLLHTTQHMFEELEHTLSKIRDDSTQTGVTMAATTYVAARWLSSRLGAFNDAFPDTVVRLQHSVNSADFKLCDVDLAIQWGACDKRGNRHRFAQIPMPLYPAISPKLLAKHGVNPAQPLETKLLFTTALKNVPLLCEDRQLDLWQEWFEANVPLNIGQSTNPRRVISDANVRVQAAIDGQGMILADDLVLNEINNGLLNVPFEPTLQGYGYSFLSSAGSVLSEPASRLKLWLTKEACSN